MNVWDEAAYVVNKIKAAITNSETSIKNVIPDKNKVNSISTTVDAIHSATTGNNSNASLLSSISEKIESGNNHIVSKIGLTEGLIGGSIKTFSGQVTSSYAQPSTILEISGECILPYLSVFNNTPSPGTNSTLSDSVSIWVDGDVIYSISFDNAGSSMQPSTNGYVTKRWFVGGSIVSPMTKDVYEKMFERNSGIEENGYIDKTALSFPDSKYIRFSKGSTQTYNKVVCGNNTVNPGDESVYLSNIVLNKVIYAKNNLKIMHGGGQHPTEGTLASTVYYSANVIVS